MHVWWWHVSKYENYVYMYHLISIAHQCYEMICYDIMFGLGLATLLLSWRRAYNDVHGETLGPLR